MRAHQIDGNGLIINTIEVDSLGDFENLIDGSTGGIGDTWDGTQIIPAHKPEVDLDQLKKILVADIDDHIAAICAKWTRFQAGYLEREAAARAFKAASYVGDAGEWITSFATPAGLTPPVAANLIITQADGLKAALKALEAARMKKYSVARATTEQAVRSAYAAVIAEANTIAAGIS